MSNRLERFRDFDIAVEVRCPNAVTHYSKWMELRARGLTPTEAAEAWARAEEPPGERGELIGKGV
jgi:hypothetical protein